MWECGELKLYFSPSAGGKEKKKKKVGLTAVVKIPTSASS